MERKSKYSRKEDIGICRVCGVDFKDDIVLPHRKYICRKCWNEYSKNQARKIASTLEGFFEITMNSIRNTPRRKKYGYDIDVDYLIKLYNLQEGKCAISGIEMTIGFDNNLDDNIKNNHYRNPYNISVDRIDSEKGYTKDNIILVCGCINWLKNTILNIDDVYNIATEMHENKNRYVEVRELIDNMIVAESIVS